VVVLVLWVRQSEGASRTSGAPGFITPGEVIGRENQAGFLEHKPMCGSGSV